MLSLFFFSAIKHIHIKTEVITVDKTLEAVFKCFGNEFYNSINKACQNISEVRIRSDKPVVLYINNTPYFIDTSGRIFYPNLSLDSIRFTFSEIKNAFCKLCEYSVYKHQKDINNGFITVRGGHRIGICGTAVILDSEIKSVVDITSMNIRAAREYIGCSESFFRTVEYDDGVLICGIPSSGKTTLLRDISRILTAEKLFKAAVIDERCEISSSFNGRSNFDLGLCDIYCGFPKDKAVFQAIRTMSPDFIICDELTGNDIDSVSQTLNYGVRLIATVHCDSLKNALKNPSIVRLLKTKAFRKIVFLNSKMPCKIDHIYDLEDITLD